MIEKDADNQLYYSKLFFGRFLTNDKKIKPSKPIKLKKSTALFFYDITGHYSVFC